jgi:hypothetical protein
MTKRVVNPLLPFKYLMVNDDYEVIFFEVLKHIPDIPLNGKPFFLDVCIIFLGTVESACGVCYHPFFIFLLLRWGSLIPEF